MICRQQITHDVSWNAIIGAHVKHGESKKALALFDDMLAAGIAPDHVTLTSVLPACGDIGSLTRGKELHSLIIKNGIPIDDFLGAALINMYGRTGALDEAIALFDNMRKQQQHSHANNNDYCGVGTWNAMIGAYGDHRCVKEALSLFEKMPDSGLIPNQVTLVVILSACSHGGLVDTALNIINTMQSRFGIPPETLHHNCIIDALGRAGRLAEAEEYLLANQSNSNVVSWIALLGACRIHGDVKRGERAAQQIRHLAPNDAGPQVLMANIYASAGLWEDKDRVRQRMKDDGVKKIPGISSIEVGGKLHEFMVGDTRHEQIHHIQAHLSDLWEEMKAAGFVPKISTVLHDMTDGEKDDHLCQHSEKLALAFGLLNTPEGTPLIVTKNLRVCPDCHEATSFIARLKRRKISVRDASSWHHYDGTTGCCSCNNYW